MFCFISNIIDVSDDTKKEEFPFTIHHLLFRPVIVPPTHPRKKEKKRNERNRFPIPFLLVFLIISQIEINDLREERCQETSGSQSFMIYPLMIGGEISLFFLFFQFFGQIRCNRIYCWFDLGGIFRTNWISHDLFASVGG